MDWPRVEARILLAVDHVLRGEKNEDDVIEFKTALPEPHPAARRIAGQLNASRGEPVLWVVGLDEATGRFFKHEADLASWWPSVQKRFDDKAPNPGSRVVHVDDSNAVLALWFEPTDPPYVVRNPRFGVADGGPVEWEIPWRELTTTRSARRADVLRVLVPALRAPEVEVVSGFAELLGQKPSVSTYLRVRLFIYVVPRSEDTVVVPFRRCSGVVRYGPAGEELDLRVESILPRTMYRTDDHGAGHQVALNPRIVVTRDDLGLSVPSMVKVTAGQRVSADHALLSAQALSGHVRMHVVGVEAEPTVEFEMLLEESKSPERLRQWRQGEEQGDPW